MSCPSCGAKSSPDGRRCDYCEAPLALRTCARCFGAIFAGSKHCRHCGASTDDAAQLLPDRNAPRSCPRCGPTASLVANLVGDVLLDECPSCGGLFLDTASVQRLVADRERQVATQQAIRAAPVVPERPQAFEQKPVYLKCPDCEQLMARQNFGRRSGVIVDVCRPHGTWFDADELRRVLEFIEGGGLDRARQDQLEEAKRETEHRVRMQQVGRIGGVEAGYGHRRSQSLWAEALSVLAIAMVGWHKD